MDGIRKPSCISGAATRCSHGRMPAFPLACVCARTHTRTHSKHTICHSLTDIFCLQWKSQFHKCSREFTHVTQMHLLANTNTPDSVLLLMETRLRCAHMRKGMARDVFSGVTDLALLFSERICSCKHRKQSERCLPFHKRSAPFSRSLYKTYKQDDDQ